MYRGGGGGFWHLSTHPSGAGALVASVGFIPPPPAECQPTHGRGGRHPVCITDPSSLEGGRVGISNQDSGGGGGLRYPPFHPSSAVAFAPAAVSESKRALGRTRRHVSGAAGERGGWAMDSSIIGGGCFSRVRHSAGGRRRYAGNAAGRSRVGRGVRVRAVDTRPRLGGSNGGVASPPLVRPSGAVAIAAPAVPEPKPALGRGRCHPPSITGLSDHDQPCSTLWPAPAGAFQASAAQHCAALRAPAPSHSRPSPSAAFGLRGGPGTALHHVHRVRSGTGRRPVRYLAPHVPVGRSPAVGPKWYAAT